MKGAVDAVAPGTSRPQPPPFAPGSIPPLSLFSDSQSSVIFVGTDYSPRTLLWALNTDGLFNRNFTSQNFPELELYTNSTLWQLLAPGLMKFPNMDIQVSVYLAAPFSLVWLISHFSNSISKTLTLLFPSYLSCNCQSHSQSLYRT